jgi:hypothetical protein
MPGLGCELRWVGVTVRVSGQWRGNEGEEGGGHLALITAVNTWFSDDLRAGFKDVVK